MAKRQTAGPSSDGLGSKTQAAKEQTSAAAHGVAEAGGKITHGVAEAGGRLTHTAGEQGRQVATEAGRQARNLVGEASSEVRRQASVQQKRAAGGLRKLGDELQSMSSQSDGMAGELVRRASGVAGQAANWLERREPGAIVDELRDFARRHPSVFLASAMVAGALAGRVTRSITARDGMGGDGGRAVRPEIPGTPGAAATGPPAPEPSRYSAAEPMSEPLGQQASAGAYRGSVTP